MTMPQNGHESTKVQTQTQTPGVGPAAPRDGVSPVVAPSPSRSMVTDAPTAQPQILVPPSPPRGMVPIPDPYVLATGALIGILLSAIFSILTKWLERRWAREDKRNEAQKTLLLELQEAVSVFVFESENRAENIKRPVVDPQGKRFDFDSLKDRLYAAERRVFVLLERVRDDQVRDKTEEFLNHALPEDWHPRDKDEAMNEFGRMYDRYKALSKCIGVAIRSIS